MFLDRKKIRNLILKEISHVINEQESNVPDEFYSLSSIEQVLHMLNEGSVMPYAFERRGNKIIMTSPDYSNISDERIDDILEITIRELT